MILTLPLLNAIPIFCFHLVRSIIYFYILDLSECESTENLRTLRLHEDEQIVEDVCSTRWIGRWASEWPS